jgi:hypothetical protein
MTRDELAAKVETLLPCPFCGGDPMPDFSNIEGEAQYHFHCQSKECLAWPNVQGDTEAEAITAWNTRHRTRHEDALKEALREARDYVHDTARGYLVNGQCDSNILRGQASEILTRIDSLLADKEPG